MNRSDLAGRIDTVEHRMDSIRHRLGALFAALTTQILQSNRETCDVATATLRDKMLAMGARARVEMTANDGTLRRERWEMSAGLRGEIEKLYEEMYALHGLSTHPTETLETVIAEGRAEERRFLLTLHEEVMSQLALLDERLRN